ncbi:MAG: methylmalonyl-CoA mutase cobalamin-binding subunit [Ilumatobacter sp.]|jgi:methylmalonyl-CoA mutase cobalamin-binding subunit
MATVALREANWHVHHLGADIPGDEIISFCAAHPDVDVAVISVTSSDSADPAEQVAQQLRSGGTPTLVGAAGKTLGDLVTDVQHAAASSDF